MTRATAGLSRPFGDACYELDALDPNTLRDRVRTVIETMIEWDRWQRAEVVEQAELTSLRDILTQWPAASEVFSSKQHNRFEVPA